MPIDSDAKAPKKRRTKTDDLDDDLIDESEHEEGNSKDNWVRGLYILLFFAISYIVAFVMFFVVVFQFISDVFFKKPNAHITEFGNSVSIYAAQIIRYITYNTDEMPFPFQSWPKPSRHDDND